MLQDLLGFPPQVLFGQLLLGLINGAFYAVLSLGLAVIFGLVITSYSIHYTKLYEVPDRSVLPTTANGLLGTPRSYSCL